ncbi:unannotated protein [freshwater metagenome]|uniref:Unannotated protein n=1 Tax=freshwater metagenome TaxID=449393 RepID=A0A6J6TTR8_9ZZZZ|nr:SpoIID/LytB domain-containing protein [Actinomycetota bacterium]
MKRFAIAFVLISFSLTSQASAIPPKSFTFTGSGYGHGVGLSQYGAKGQALEGRTATEILNYYFPDAQVTPVPDSRTISVNIAHQVLSLSLSIPIDDFFTIQGEGLIETSTALGANLSFVMANNLISNSTVNAKSWIIKWSNPNSVVTLNYGTTKFLVNHGYIKLRAVKATSLGYRIEATNLLRLHDEYLYGIAEVPSSWPAATLQSQVIASRTYALMRMNSIKKACDCHVYNSKYDQAFVGFSKEGEARYGQFWKAAVDATAIDAENGLAITIDGAPISVFFSSSTGGMTQRAVDVWGTEIPHLVSVPDPWSIDPAINKNYASWTKKVSQKAMAKAFGLPDVERYEIASRTATNSVLFITGYSSTGVSKTLPVATFKTAVKLPSSWFDLPIS